MSDERVQIEIRADPQQALAAIAQVQSSVDRLLRTMPAGVLPGRAPGSPVAPPAVGGAGRSRMPSSGSPAINAPPAISPAALDARHAKAMEGQGMPGALRQMMNSGNLTMLPIFRNPQDASIWAKNLGLNLSSGVSTLGSGSSGGVGGGGSGIGRAASSQLKALQQQATRLQEELSIGLDLPETNAAITAQLAQVQAQIAAMQQPAGGNAAPGAAPASGRSRGASRGVGGAVSSALGGASSLLGPLAGVASAGFVGSSVNQYWQMASAAGAAWASAGMPGSFNGYFGGLQSMAGAQGYTIPTATSALSAYGMASGTTGTGPAGALPAILQASRALGLDPSTAAQLLGTIASYGSVAQSSVSAPTNAIAGAAMSSGIAPQQFLSAVASLVQTAGTSNGSVNAAGVTGLLQASGALANSTGLSMFRGSNGASWLQQFQGATQQGLGGNAGQLVTMQAVAQAYAQTHGGQTPGTFQTLALQSQGPLGWGSPQMTSAYVNSLWSKFGSMGTAGDLLMAQSLGMSTGQFYSLMQNGGIGAVTKAFGQQSTPGSSSAVASAASSYMSSPAGGVASAESTISQVTATIGQDFSPAIVQATKDLGSMSTAMQNILGSGGMAATLATAIGVSALPIPAWAQAAIVASVGAGAAIYNNQPNTTPNAPTPTGPAQAGTTPGLPGAAGGPTLGGLGLSGSATTAVENMVNKYGNTITAAANKYGIDPNMLTAVMYQESGGNPNAKAYAYTNSAGQKVYAQGLMQILNGSTNPTTNVNQGASMLGSYMAKYQQPWEALTAYTAGPGSLNDLLGILGQKGLSPTWGNAQPYLYQAERQAGLTPTQKQVQQAISGINSELTNTQVWDANNSLGWNVSVQVTVSPMGSGTAPQ